MAHQVFQFCGLRTAIATPRAAATTPAHLAAAAAASAAATAAAATAVSTAAAAAAAAVSASASAAASSASAPAISASAAAPSASASSATAALSSHAGCGKRLVNAATAAASSGWSQPRHRCPHPVTLRPIERGTETRCTLGTAALIVMRHGPTVVSCPAAVSRPAAVLRSAARLPSRQLPVARELLTPAQEAAAIAAAAFKQFWAGECGERPASATLCTLCTIWAMDR